MPVISPEQFGELVPQLSSPGGQRLTRALFKILNIDDDEFAEVEGDADSIAGLILELKGDFPSIHEKIEYRNPKRI